MLQHASSLTQEGASTSRPSCSSYIGFQFQSANMRNSRSPCWCTRHCMTSCLRIWRKIAVTCVCHCRTPTTLRSSDIDTCLAQRTNTGLGDHSFALHSDEHSKCISAAWTSVLVVRGPCLRSLTAAAPSDSVFRALCTNSLIYLLILS